MIFLDGPVFWRVERVLKKLVSFWFAFTHHRKGVPSKRLTRMKSLFMLPKVSKDVQNRDTGTPRQTHKLHLASEAPHTPILRRPTPFSGAKLLRRTVAEGQGGQRKALRLGCVCVCACLLACVRACLLACLLAWFAWFVWLFVCLFVCLLVLFVRLLACSFVCSLACLVASLCVLRRRLQDSFCKHLLSVRTKSSGGSQRGWCFCLVLDVLNHQRESTPKMGSLHQKNNN